jgi:hypothetical protein
MSQTVGRVYNPAELPIALGQEAKPALTTSAELLVRFAAGVIAIVAGNQTPGDAVATPSDAVDTRTWVQLANAAGNSSSLARGRAILNAVSQGSNSAFAADTVALLTGRSSTVASQQNAAFVDTGGQLFVTVNGGTLTTYANNQAFAAMATQWLEAFTLMRAQSAVLADFTNATWSAPSMSVKGDAFALDGRPALNARNNPDNTAAANFGTGADNTVVNAACVLRWYHAFNLDAAATIYVQVHLTGAAVIAGAIPLWTFPLGPTGTAAASTLRPDRKHVLTDSSGGGGLFCSTGVHLVASTTAGTYTAAATAFLVNYSFYTG